MNIYFNFLYAQFVLVAQNISQKLRLAGFWADFINPFSGLPGISTHYLKDDLYGTDPKFRSLGFRISERKNCRIIEETKSKQFKGEWLSIIYFLTLTIDSMPYTKIGE